MRAAWRPAGLMYDPTAIGTLAGLLIGSGSRTRAWSVSALSRDASSIGPLSSGLSTTGCAFVSAAATATTAGRGLASTTAGWALKALEAATGAAKRAGYAAGAVGSSPAGAPVGGADAAWTDAGMAHPDGCLGAAVGVLGTCGAEPACDPGLSGDTGGCTLATAGIGLARAAGGNAELAGGDMAWGNVRPTGGENVEPAGGADATGGIDAAGGNIAPAGGGDDACGNAKLAGGDVATGGTAPGADIGLPGGNA